MSVGVSLDARLFRWKTHALYLRQLYLKAGRQQQMQFRQKASLMTSWGAEGGTGGTAQQVTFGGEMEQLLWREMQTLLLQQLRASGKGIVSLQHPW